MLMLSRIIAVAHRWLERVGQLSRRRAMAYTIFVGIAIYGVMLRCLGIGRSLWLDEAWVANSIATRSFREMFYYNAWLQSSPPLFLVLARISVALFGLNNTVLRTVPLLMGLLSAFIMLLLVRRVMLRAYAVLAFVMLVLSPLAVEFSRVLKQYSSELAASTMLLLICILYFENPTVRRFWLLVLTVVTCLLLGYAVAFVLPGIVLTMSMSPIRTGASSPTKASKLTCLVRPLLLSIVAGVTLICEYLLLIAPNSPEVLRAWWAKKDVGANSSNGFVRSAASNAYHLIGELPLNHELRRQSLLLSAFGAVIIAGVVLAWLRFRNRRRKWLQLQIVCLVPVFGLIVSDWFDWYPFTERTTLFALPFVIVLLLSSLQLGYLFVLRGRWSLRPILDVAVLAAIAITIVAGRGNFSSLKTPYEDADGAVSFLQTHVQPRDFLWVHASCSEVFKLYAKMDGWKDAPVHYGNTGWPCCPRGVSINAERSESLVRNDFGGALPINFRGRVWLLYTARPGHWAGAPDEPQIMKTLLRERECVEMSTPSFRNLGVSDFDCHPRAVPERIRNAPPRKHSPFTPRPDATVQP